jgi:hypothetical protein
MFPVADPGTQLAVGAGPAQAAVRQNGYCHGGGEGEQGNKQKAKHRHNFLSCSTSVTSKLG